MLLLSIGYLVAISDTKNDLALIPNVNNFLLILMVESSSDGKLKWFFRGTEPPKWREIERMSRNIRRETLVYFSLLEKIMITSG